VKREPDISGTGDAEQAAYLAAFSAIIRLLRR
jgi:hypothetical protein